MASMSRIEQALLNAIEPGESAGCPPLLASAIRYAVFPPGARIRPRLCLAVAMANAEDRPVLADGAAAAIELLHCASLIHDDLPCFDDAPTRRGKPSVHRAYGERLAVLAGDAMIVMAFETLAETCAAVPERLRALTRIVGRSVGTAGGIVAGQAWECEPRAVLDEYQRAKTGSLFAAATMAGAAAAGVADYARWSLLGERLGEAYQVADDVLDVAGDTIKIGKPVGRDAALGRPSAVAQFGLPGALQLLKRLIAEANAAIPDCPGSVALRAIISAEAQGLVPRELLLAA